MAPFCSERKIDLIQLSVGARVDFLAMLYEKGLSYSSINTARCALSAILDPDGASRTTFGQHPDIKRFMKGTFQCRPPLPRNNKTCDVNIVLQHIISMDDSNNLPVKEVTMKLAMLVTLTTAQRRQSLHLMDTEGMVAEKEAYTFLMDTNIKQSRPTKSPSERIIRLKVYPTDKKLCVVDTCSVYLRKTRPIRGNESSLFLTSQKPHKKASRDTIRRWIQQLTQLSKIDVIVYKRHSVRSAASSKAKANKASLLEIMKTAGWGSVATFARFYDKEIDTSQAFPYTVLTS